MQSVFVFLIWQNLLFPVKNADVSRTQGMCHMIHIIFGFV